MTHKDLLSAVQKVCQLDQQQCSMLLNALCKIMAKAGVEQVNVTLPGLGTFVSHKHPEYIQEDPKTGQQTLFPPRISYRLQREDDESQVTLLNKQLSESSKTEPEVAGQFIVALVNAIQNGLDHGEEVEVHGLGYFRMVSSEQAGVHRISYTPDDMMRESVNAPFNCFEPIVITPAPTEPKTEEPEAVVTTEEIEPQHVADEPEEEIVENIESKKVIEEPKSVFEESKKETVEPIMEKPASTVEQKISKPKNGSVFVFAVCGIIAIACAALLWFFFSYNKASSNKIFSDKEAVPAEVIAEEVEEGPEIFFGEEHAIKEDVDSATNALNDEPEAKPSEVKPAEPEPEAKPAPKPEVKPVPKPEVKPAPKPTASGANVASLPATGAPTWHIQFLMTSRQLAQNAPELKGLSNVYCYKDGGSYKYVTGSAASSAALSSDLKKVRELFPQAFCAKFDANGNRMK